MSTQTHDDHFDDVQTKLQKILDVDWSEKLIEAVKNNLDDNKRFNSMPHGMKRPVDFKVVGAQYHGNTSRDMWYDCTPIREEELIRPALTAEDLVHYFCEPGIQNLARAFVAMGPVRVGHRYPARPIGGILQRVYPGKIPVRVTIETDCVYFHTRIMFDVRVTALDETRADAVAENKNIVRIDLNTPFMPSGITRVDISERFNPKGVVAMVPTREITEEDWEWTP